MCHSWRQTHIWINILFFFSWFFIHTMKKYNNQKAFLKLNLNYLCKEVNNGVKTSPEICTTLFKSGLNSDWVQPLHSCLLSQHLVWWRHIMVNVLTWFCHLLTKGWHLAFKSTVQFKASVEALEVSMWLKGCRSYKCSSSDRTKPLHMVHCNKLCAYPVCVHYLRGSCHYSLAL